MAVDFGTASAASAATTTWNVAKPASLVSGEMVVGFVGCDSGTPSITGGSTWSTLASGAAVPGTSMGYWVGWKMAGGSEPTNYTASQGASSTGHASIIRPTGAGGTPVYAVNAAGQGSTSISTPTVTPTGVADLLIRFVVGTGEGATVAWTAPASHTERTDNQASGGNATGSTATRLLSSSAATGTASFTASSFSSNSVGITVSVTAGSFDQTVSPSGIASAEAVGTAQLNHTIAPGSIASGETFGDAIVTTPQISIISPTGIVSGEAFGTATLGLFLRPSGIASGEAFGAGRLSAVIGPSGIVSGEAFGTTNLAIEQFISPAGIISQEAFGDARPQLGYPQTLFVSGIASRRRVGTPTAKLLQRQVLKNPSVQETPAGSDRLFMRFGLHRGISIIKRQDGSYYSSRYPAQTELEEAEAYYLGGRWHDVTNEIADELVAAGYGAYLDLVDADQ